MSYYTLAVSSSNHDSSICLLRDSEILVAFSCERINKMKHTQRIEQVDINVIAKYTKIVDKLVLVNVLTENEINNGQSYYNAFTISESVKNIRAKINKAGIQCSKVIVDNRHHHLYHAAAGFYTSGLQDAICIVIDGFGSVETLDDIAFAETTTIFHAKETIETLHKQLLYKFESPKMTGWDTKQILHKQNSYKFPTVITSHLDIGKMYGTVTRYIGFYAVDAGKTMGLSAYGKPNNLPPMLMEGTIISNANLFRYDSQIDALCYPELQDPDDQTKKNMAYNVQKALEKIFVERVASALKIKYSDNVILGGGCALNILGNSEIKRHFPDLNVYPEPIAADAAQSIGAALYHYKLEFPSTRFRKIDNLYFGPDYKLPDVKQRLLQLVEQYNNESSLQIVSN